MEKERTGALWSDLTEDSANTRGEVKLVKLSKLRQSFERGHIGLEGKMKNFFFREQQGQGQRVSEKKGPSYDFFL